MAGMKARYTVYADDTCLVYTAKSELRLEEIMNEDLKIFKNWIDGNCLTLNAKKTKYMVFRMKNKTDVKMDIKIEQESIERVETIRYLGTQIDVKLTWSHHIENVTKKIIPVVGAIRRSRIDKRMAKIIYNAHVLPHVRYLSIVWTQTSKSNLARIQRLLTRAVKILYGLERLTPTEEVYRLTRALKLEEIVYVEKAKFIHKALKGGIKTNVALVHNREVHNYQTRNVDNLRTEKARTDRVNTGLSKAAAIIYNEIPAEIREVNNIHIFTRRCIKHIKQLGIVREREF